MTLHQLAILVIFVLIAAVISYFACDRFIASVDPPGFKGINILTCFNTKKVYGFMKEKAQKKAILTEEMPTAEINKAEQL